MIVDTDSGATRVIANGNAHHAHGMCQPLAALAGESVDGIIVGGIGMGALMKLQAAGITVYRAVHPTVAETVEAFKRGLLQPIGQDGACAHHGHLATGFVVGYPPCPHIDHFERFIPEKYGIPVVIGTHPIPQKYFLTHERCGTWQDPAWPRRLRPTLADEPTRLAYD